MSRAQSPIIVALDYATSAQALAMADRLDPALCRVKVGKELFVAAGPAVVEALRQRGFEVFLDLKFHDIPNTVAGACRSAAALGVWMLNVHALGGPKMLQAARAAVDASSARPLLIGVTVLTSHDAAELAAIGIAGSPLERALSLAALVHDADCDGVVCSAHEASAMRARFGESFLRVTPGIRLSSEIADDQARIVTPAAAVAAGANYLVIGRPITQSADPAATLHSIVESLKGTQ